MQMAKYLSCVSLSKGIAEGTNIYRKCCKFLIFTIQGITKPTYFSAAIPFKAQYRRMKELA